VVTVVSSSRVCRAQMAPDCVVVVGSSELQLSSSALSATI